MRRAAPQDVTCHIAHVHVALSVYRSTCCTSRGPALRTEAVRILQSGRDRLCSYLSSLHVLCSVRADMLVWSTLKMDAVAPSMRASVAVPGRCHWSVELSPFNH